MREHREILYCNMCGTRLEGAIVIHGAKFVHFVTVIKVDNAVRQGTLSAARLLWSGSKVLYCDMSGLPCVGHDLRGRLLFMEQSLFILLQ